MDTAITTLKLFALRYIVWLVILGYNLIKIDAALIEREKRTGK